MPLFERDVLVRIGVENLTEEIDVRDLRVLFDINKSLDKKKTNTAQIQIYNLKETHRKKINQIDNVIGLEAGYKDENNRALIFKGNITDVSFDATGGDHITTINAGDGDKAFKEVKFTKSYVAGTSAEQIFNDVINQFGLPKKLTERIKEQLTKKGSQYANAFSAAGRAKDILNKITGKLGYEWSIQDTNLKV
ncbi:MAG: hypothetical protein KAU20_07650, partial [Nanoarchaeota archaeon]|nr:hypothetical protein [Nanoarchaeota archaeon]